MFPGLNGYIYKNNLLPLLKFLVFLIFFLGTFPCIIKNI
jgi:hypothetical protein